MMRMLDLFSGSGSASRAAAVRGWEVVRIDNGEGTAHDIRADLATWQPSGVFDLVWASPPCTRLSTASRTRDVESGLVLVDVALRIIRALRPRWWVLENVHGATRAIASRIGPPVACYGSFYLWGVFPPFEASVPRDKTKLSGRRRAERRAAIPWPVAEGLTLACERLARELPTCPAPASDGAPPGPELAPSSPRSSSGPSPLELPPAPEQPPESVRASQLFRDVYESELSTHQLNVLNAHLRIMRSNGAESAVVTLDELGELLRVYRARKEQQ